MTAARTAPETPPVYYSAVDRILIRHLKTPAAIAQLRRSAEAGDADPVAQLTHAAALHARERGIQLARKIKHALADLQAAEAELADGRCAEHLLSQRTDEVTVAAHRHHEAITQLEKLARAWASATTARARVATD